MPRKLSAHLTNHHVRIAPQRVIPVPQPIIEIGVPVRRPVAETRPFRFLVDTGADFCHFSASFAARLGIPYDSSGEPVSRGRTASGHALTGYWGELQLALCGESPRVTCFFTLPREESLGEVSGVPAQRRRSRPPRTLDDWAGRVSGELVPRPPLGILGRAGILEHFTIHLTHRKVVVQRRRWWPPF